jgi:hypothetical protein
LSWIFRIGAFCPFPGAAVVFEFWIILLLNWTPFFGDRILDVVFEEKGSRCVRSLAEAMAVAWCFVRRELVSADVNIDVETGLSILFSL